MEFIATLMLLAVSIIVLLTVISAMVLLFISTLLTEVPFVPVSKTVIREALKRFRGVTNDSVFYDLGSGDGRVVFAFKDAHPETSSTGYEIGPLPYLIAHMNNALRGSVKANIQRRDFFKEDLSNGTHIFLYLFPNTMEKLFDKFSRELKPGTQVISCDFPFRTKAPTDTVEVSDTASKHVLYMYEF